MILARVFPFLDWFHKYSSDKLRRDLIGGLTVALVLVPQSMAYAQLAGLPAYYGLYASFLPPLVAALFGSSRQLATGPVAVVSLMTATALEPLATTGSEAYIAYAILLALLVGVFQFMLGILRLGLVVNFMSHPVVNGFTNAAAIIIASSQLSKLFGVSVDSAEHHYETIYNVIKAAVSFTHWPTLALAVLAFGVMIILRRINPRIPNVLVAVIVTTIISWAIGFERMHTTDLAAVECPEVQNEINHYITAMTAMNERTDQRVHIREQYDRAVADKGERSTSAIELQHDMALANIEIEEYKTMVREHRARLRGVLLEAHEIADRGLVFYKRGAGPDDAPSVGGNWRLKVGNKNLDPEKLILTGGGAVVGNIPSGLPSISVPRFELSTAISLFSIAMIISLLGFMEAISIAKAIAAKTGHRLDPNQELIGQGLANIVGSLGQSYAVSGSFSRSAVNLQAGAVTGLSNVFSSMIVVITLLFFTPLLYHLPQSVLAAIIMMAVVGLVNVKVFIHTWRAQRYDGIIGLISFICTLAFAPHLDRGIIIGIVLSLLLYLLRNMKPAIAMLSLHPDGTYRSRIRFDLDQCKHIAVVRYAGSLFFANVSYLEDQILDTVRNMPDLQHILIVGNGINELDASGEEMLVALVNRLHERGLGVSISGLNDSVLDVMRRTGLLALIGEENLYRNATRAISAIWEKTHLGTDETNCPLKVVPFKRFAVAPTSRTRKDMTAPKNPRDDNPESES